MIILDFLVHGGHQYEFFKNNTTFYCMGINNEIHTHESLGRPKQSNVNFINDELLGGISPDIIIVRAKVNYGKYEKFIKNGAKAIAVVQTTKPFDIPSWCKTVVWNSKVAMEKHRRNLPGKNHFHIVHGFDPNEFQKLNLEKNNRIISSYSLFKERGTDLGFGMWSGINNVIQICDLIGHGNSSIKNSIGSYPLPELTKIYNSYSAYLNTATNSAMPRSRGEAMMCGTPIITTSNSDSSFYFKNYKNCLIADNINDGVISIKRILSNKNLRIDLSEAARETAIKHFDIKDYLKKWNNIFSDCS